MQTTAVSTRESMFLELQSAIARLADCVDDDPLVAGALRRFARTLPGVPPVPRPAVVATGSSASAPTSPSGR